MRITWYREFPAGTMEFVEPVCKIEEYAADGTLTFYETITEGENGEWVTVIENYTEPNCVKKTTEHTIFPGGATRTIDKFMYKDGRVHVIESINGEIERSYYIDSDDTEPEVKDTKPYLDNE